MCCGSGGVMDPRLRSLLMRWRPSISGKLCTVFPSETFSVTMDVGLEGRHRFHPWAAQPFQPFWGGDSGSPSLPSAPSPTQSKSMGSQGWRNLFPLCQKITTFIRITAGAGFLFHPYNYRLREAVSLAPLNGEVEAQRSEPACPKTHSQE